MRFRVLLVGLLVLLFAAGADAQAKSDLMQSRILILLDESSSMIQPWSGNKEKYKAAREIILRIMDSVYAFNSDVEFSLRVFGHQYTVKENNCYDTKNEVGFTKSNRTQMEMRLSDIRPLGVTPIAYALTQAAENDLIDEAHNAYSIILITDGGESCGGDLCAVMRSLIASKVFFKPYIVGLEDSPELRTSYKCMGNFLPVTKPADMPGAVSTIVEAFRPIIKITKNDYKEIKALGGVPSILKVAAPAAKEPVVEQPKKPAPVVKPTLQPVAAIQHLDVAPILIPNTTLPVPEKLVKRAIPHPIIEEITLPKTAIINHLQTADLSDFGTTEIPRAHMSRYPIPGPPVSVMQIEMPKATAIDHMAALPLKDPDANPMGAIPLKKALAPAAPEVVTEIPEAPKVPTIAHLQPLELKGYASTPPPAQPVALVKPLPPVIVEDAPPPPPPPPPAPVAAPIAHLKPAGIKMMESPVASAEPLKLVKPIAPPAMQERETPVIPTVPKISHLSPAKLAMANITPIAQLPLRLVTPTVVVDDIKVTPEKPTVDKINRLKTSKLIEPRVIFIIEDHVLKQRTPPPPPTFAPIPSAALTVSKPAFAPAKPPVAPGITSGYTVETVEAKETSLMVYFTNGHGKFYQSMPQVLIVEPLSNKILKKFYRTIDPAGLPDPQKDVPVGTFNISIADKRNLVLHDVEIVANKMNKVIVKLKNCSLEFAYDGAKDRPVSEFIATVIERNVPNGKVINQKCTQKLEYEPGNYHLIIHCYPEDVRNVDLDFDDTKIITIAQPGFVKFTTDMKNRKLNLFKPVNDKFLTFDSKNSSDTALQHLQIQPGQYQVRYLKDPTKPYAKETIIPFQVKSNEVTEVPLPSN